MNLYRKLDDTDAENCENIIKLFEFTGCRNYLKIYLNKKTNNY